MNELILENVRCFRSRQEISLRPLTLLVGENSTGKSTFLAATRLAVDLGGMMSMPDFNQEPFILGAYDQIASYFGGRAGRAKHFTIGFGTSAGYVTRRGRPSRRVAARALPSIRLTGRFTSQEGQPVISEYKMESDANTIWVIRAEEPGVFHIRIKIRGRQIVRRQLLLGGFPLYGRGEGRLVSDLLNPYRYRPVIPEQTFKAMQPMFRALYWATVSRPYAFAPIRMRPERTYDPKSDAARPEGNHVPMLLARIIRDKPEVWARLQKALCAFASECGLFASLGVRRLGKTASDPFRIMVKIAGPGRNLVDVGYGVSQVLPILSDILMGNPGQIFLLQQPEVHLHPRAQAELGTFLGQAAAKEDKRFLVETHSDYLVDRIRLDVRDKRSGLTPGQVLILYFEREHSDVTVHPITIDEQGNLENVPRSFREFFLREESRFLGV